MTFDRFNSQMMKKNKETNKGIVLSVSNKLVKFEKIKLRIKN